MGFRGNIEDSGLVGGGNKRLVDLEHLRLWGQNDRSILQEASPRKVKTNRVHFARRLSKLVQHHPVVDDLTFRLELEEVEVHKPTRSISVDSRPCPAFSRRQILASLAEESNPPSICSSESWSPLTTPPSSPRAWSSPPEDLPASPKSWSSVLEAPPPNSNSPSPTPNTVFSRACLIQSISREESTTPDRLEPLRGKLSDGSDDACRESRSSDSSASTEASSSCSSSSSSTAASETEDEDSEEVEKARDPKQCRAASELQLQDLSWVATLGVGGFGRVELVTCGQESFALKKIKKSEVEDSKQQQHILHEKSIMLSCRSPFIVQLFNTFQDSRYLYMLMEPCLGGELWTLLRNNKRFDDRTASFYVACVLLALEYLHSLGIIYRDLKPENLLLDSTGYVKLTDFGFAKQIDVSAGERAWTFCGTPEYVAPEVITNKSHDTRADIWSLGILVYELLTGTPPFNGKKKGGQNTVYPEILKGMRTVVFPQTISASASEIIRQCCRLSANQRPSLAILKHFMWFAGFDWTRLAERSLPPPKVPSLKGPLDSSNFDSFKKEEGEAKEDFSDWAKDF